MHKKGYKQNPNTATADVKTSSSDAPTVIDATQELSRFDFITLIIFLGFSVCILRVLHYCELRLAMDFNLLGEDTFM